MINQELVFIETLEYSRTKAMMSGDWASLEALLGDDLIYGHSSGSVDTKASMLTMLRSGKLSYIKIEPKIENAARIAPNVVAATGMLRTVAAIDGAERRLHGRYICVWVETRYGWRLQALQGTDSGPK